MTLQEFIIHLDIVNQSTDYLGFYSPYSILKTQFRNIIGERSCMELMIKSNYTAGHTPIFIVKVKDLLKLDQEMGGLDLNFHRAGQLDYGFTNEATEYSELTYKCYVFHDFKIICEWIQNNIDELQQQITWNKNLKSNLWNLVTSGNAQ